MYDDVPVLRLWDVNVVHNVCNTGFMISLSMCAYCVYKYYVIVVVFIN